MPEPDKIKALYDAISPTYAVGTLDEFTQKLQDPAKRKSLYDAVGKEFNIGDYDTFEQKVVLEKKSPGGSPQSVDGSLVSSEQPKTGSESIRPDWMQEQPVAQTPEQQWLNEEIDVTPAVNPVSEKIFEFVGAKPEKQTKTRAQLVDEYNRLTQAQSEQGVLRDMVSQGFLDEVNEQIDKDPALKHYIGLQNVKKKTDEKYGGNEWAFQLDMRDRLAQAYFDENEKEAYSARILRDQEQDALDRYTKQYNDGHISKEMYEGLKSRQESKIAENEEKIKAADKEYSQKFDQKVSELDQQIINAEKMGAPQVVIDKYRKYRDIAAKQAAIASKGFFDEEQQAKQLAEDLDEVSPQFSLISKELPPIKRLQQHTIMLVNEKADLDEKIGDVSYGETVRSMLPLAGGWSKDRQRQMELDNELGIIAKVAFLNRNPLAESREGFGTVLGESFLRSLSGAKEFGPQTEEFGGLSEALQVSGAGTPEEQAKGLEERQKYEPWSGQAIANTIGTSGGIMAHFIAGSKAVTGAVGKTTAWQKLEKASESGKNWMVRALATGVKRGTEYEATGQLSSSDIVKDEANFLSGFTGGTLGNITSNAAVKALGIFGVKTPQAIKTIADRGFGETGEETAQALTEIYRESETWNDFYEGVKKQFGNLSEASFFFLSTFSMGVGMGGGEIFGSKSVPAEVQNLAASQYEALTPEEKKEVDPIINEFNNQTKAVAEEVTEETTTETPIPDEKAETAQEAEEALQLSEEEVEPDFDAAANELLAAEEQLPETETSAQPQEDVGTEETLERDLVDAPPIETPQTPPAAEIVEKLPISDKIESEITEETPPLSTEVKTIESKNEHGQTEWNIQLLQDGKLTHSWTALTEKGRDSRIDLANERAAEIEAKKTRDADKQKAISEPDARGAEILSEWKKLKSTLEANPFQLLKQFKDDKTDSLVVYDESGGAHVLKLIKEGKNLSNAEFSYDGVTTQANKLPKLWVEDVAKAEREFFKSFSTKLATNKNEATLLQSGGKKTTARQQTKKAIADFKRIQKDSLLRGNTGIDPKVLAAAIKVGYYIAKEGVTDFADFSKKAIAKAGKEIEPYLKRMWETKLTALNGRSLKEISETPEAKAARKERIKEQPGSRKRRKFIRRYKDSESVSQDVKDSIPADTEFYDSISHATTENEVISLIRKRGFSEAVNDYFAENSDLEPRQKVALGLGLLNILNKEFKKTSDEEIKNQIRRIEADIAVYGTKLGQGVDAYRLFDKLSPETIGVAYERIVERLRKEALETSKPLIDKVQNEAKKTAASAARDAVDSDAVRKLLEENAKLKEQLRQAEKNKGAETIKRKISSAISKLEELKKSIGTTQAFGLTAEFYKAAITAMQGALKAGLGTINAIEAALAAARGYKKPFDESGLSEQLTQLVGEIEPDAPTVEKNVERIVRQEIRQQQINLRQLAYQHYMAQDAAKNSLVQKIMDKFNFDEATSQRIADAITEEVKKRFNAAKMSALEKMLPKPRKAAERKKEVEKLIQATNAGVLTNTKAKEIIGAILSLPEVSEEQRDKLISMSEKVQSLPEDSRDRRNAMQDLLTEMGNTKGVTGSDIAWALWYAGVLSGTKTHTLNLVSNTYKLFEETFVTSVYNLVKKGDIKGAMRTAANILLNLPAALAEMRYVMRTGYQTGKYGEELGGKNVLETLKGKPRVVQLYGGVMKYVFRALAASDMLSHILLREQQYYNLTRMALKESGVKVYGNQIDTLAKEQSFSDEQTRAQLYEQAKSETPSGNKNEINIRYYDLLSEQRDKNRLTEATTFANRGTFNYDPEGVLGVIHQLISRLTNIIPPTRVALSFTRIMSNVLNQQLDWVPIIGHARALGYKLNVLREKSALGITWTSTSPETQEQYERLLIKSTTSLIAMAALWMATGGDDDEDSPVKIHGRGPTDYQRKMTMMEGGWLPYSVQIGDKYLSYQYSGPGFALALLGNFRDAVRYEDKSGSNRAIYALSSTLKLGFESSALSQLNAVTSMFAESDADKIVENASKFFARTITSPIPNIFRNVDEAFDPSVYEAKTIWQYVVRSVPIARSSLNVKYNALGQPIMKDNLFFNALTGQKLFSGVSDDPVWNWLGDHGAPSIPVPRTPQMKGVAVTEEKANEYIIEHGRLLYEYIEENMGKWDDLSANEINDLLQEYSNKTAKNEAKKNVGLVKTSQNSPSGD